MKTVLRNKLSRLNKSGRNYESDNNPKRITENSNETIRPTEFSSFSRYFIQASWQLLRHFLFTLTAKFLKRAIYASQFLHLLFIPQPTQSFTITVSFTKFECHPLPP